MAISTVNEKLALLEWDQSWEPGLPISPGAFGQDDQQQLVWGYPGVLWGEPVPEPVPEPEVEQPVGAGGGEPYRTGGISGDAFINRRDEPRRQPEPTPAAPGKAREPSSAPATSGRSLSELLPRDQSRRQARADVRRERGPATPAQDEQARREAQAATERLIAWLEASIAESEAIALDDAEVLSLYRSHRTGLVLRYLRAAGRHDVAATIQAALDAQSREAA